MVLSKMKMWGIKNTNVVTRQSQDRLGDGQKWRAEPGSGVVVSSEGSQKQELCRCGDWRELMPCHPLPTPSWESPFSWLPLQFAQQ